MEESDVMKQPQWPRQFQVRDYVYSHTQPQWFSNEDPVVFRCPLAPSRTCASCSQPKENCKCRFCFSCNKVVGQRQSTRHHCRKCWRAFCSDCWTRECYVHMLGKPVKVCDNCAAPRAISFIGKNKGNNIMWGIYILQRAADLPRVCITPSCSSYTYGATCRKCGLPTVSTKPHEKRSIYISKIGAMDAEMVVKYLEEKESSSRTSKVNLYTEDDVERSFRSCFPRFQELDAFQTIVSSQEAQDMLLSIVSATVSYEYRIAPNLALSLSDVPYSGLLKIIRSTPRFSVFEAPGKVRFISFPGTHDYRTLTVSMSWSRVVKQITPHFVHGSVESYVWTTISDAAPSAEVTSDNNDSLLDEFHKRLEFSLHAGFAREADECMSHIKMLEYDFLQDGYRLVISGHSLGGAVAQIVALRLLMENPQLFKNKLRCVSFGSPLVGNYQLAQFVEQNGWKSNFHHIVYRSDVIPRIFCADQMTHDLTEQLVQHFNTLQTSLKQWISSFSGSNKKENPTEMMGKIDCSIRESEDPLEEEMTPVSANEHRKHRMFACFGHYHFLNFHGVNYSSTNDSETAFHTLKEGGGNGMNMGDHFLSSYNRAVMLHLYTK
ncbi:putative class 3 lipase [Trypanosoma theileri]|uniref:Putative class 3 lipase n=1 Tax=Trypanosoma theileri TaxID=67003 RepID=A0A1X0P712_9TRYP|nr:putative class 3 lipase [Trypanosoma theileri]ORC92369.1 putative class 3 lipase [Trypanosoma theileri]